MTLEEAQKEIRRRFLEGLGKNDCQKCPTCRRSNRVYHRSLHHSMAAVLILIANNRDDAPFHVSQFLVDCARSELKVSFDGKQEEKVTTGMFGDWPKLRHWGLLAKYEGARDDGSPRNGHYNITPKGRLFVEQRCLVPHAIWTYNDQFLGLVDSLQVSIPQALKKKFDYSELMGLRL